MKTSVLVAAGAIAALQCSAFSIPTDPRSIAERVVNPVPESSCPDANVECFAIRAGVRDDVWCRRNPETAGCEDVPPLPRSGRACCIDPGLGCLSCQLDISPLDICKMSEFNRLREGRVDDINPECEGIIAIDKIDRIKIWVPESKTKSSFEFNNDLREILYGKEACFFGEQSLCLSKKYKVPQWAVCQRFPNIRGCKYVPIPKRSPFGRVCSLRNSALGSATCNRGVTPVTACRINNLGNYLRSEPSPFPSELDIQCEPIIAVDQIESIKKLLKGQEDFIEIQQERVD